jgi:hypothetical protein
MQRPRNQIGFDEGQPERSQVEIVKRRLTGPVAAGDDHRHKPLGRKLPPQDFRSVSGEIP